MTCVATAHANPDDSPHRRLRGALALLCEAPASPALADTKAVREAFDSMDCQDFLKQSRGRMLHFKEVSLQIENQSLSAVSKDGGTYLFQPEQVTVSMPFFSAVTTDCRRQEGCLADARSVDKLVREASASDETDPESDEGRLRIFAIGCALSVIGAY